MSSPAAIAFAALLTASPALCADILVLKDGRIVEGRPFVQREHGVEILYENGRVFISPDYIHRILRSGPDGRLAEADQAWLEDLKALRHWRNRHKEETAHFRFETTVPGWIARDFQTYLDEFYLAVAREWEVELEGLRKLLICMYGDRSEYARTSGAGADTHYYFRLARPREINLYYDRLDPAATRASLRRCAAQAVLLLLDPELSLPRCIWEGLADCYAAARLDRRTGRIDLSPLHPRCLAELKLERWRSSIPHPKRLLRSYMLRHWDLGALDDRSDGYWSWALCRFLLHDPEYSEGFRTWVRTREEAPEADADPKMMKELWLEDLEDLATRFRAYAEKLDSRDPRVLLEVARILGRAVEYPRSGKRELGWMPTDEDSNLVALEWLETFLNRGGSDFRCYLESAKLLVRLKENQLALARLERAREIDPLHPYVYLHLGRACLGIEGLAEEGQRFLKLALELDPEDPKIQREIEGR